MEYGGTIGAESPAPAAPPAEAASDKRPVSGVLRLALAQRLLITVFVLAGAVLGVLLSKTLPPRYIASRKFIDPRGLPSAERDPSNAQDSAASRRV